MESEIRQKTSARKILTAKRRNLVLNLKLAGWPFREISMKVIEWANKEKLELPRGYDERQACQDVLRELEKLDRKNAKLAKQERAIELERCDLMQAAIWNEAMRGNEKKIDRVIRIMERRAKYLGLDAPVKAEITGEDGEPVCVIFELPDNGRRAKKESADQTAAGSTE